MICDGRFDPLCEHTSNGIFVLFAQRELGVLVNTASNVPIRCKDHERKRNRAKSPSSRAGYCQGPSICLKAASSASVARMKEAPTSVSSAIRL